MGTFDTDWQGQFLDIITRWMTERQRVSVLMDQGHVLHPKVNRGKTLLTDRLKTCDYVIGLLRSW